MSRKEIRSLLNDLVVLHDENDEFRRRLEGLQRAYETEEWQFVKDCLMTMKGVIITELLSSAHTFQPAEDKDVVQKTYYHIVQVLDFLANPLGWIKAKKNRWHIKMPVRKQPQGSNRKEK